MANVATTVDQKLASGANSILRQLIRDIRQYRMIKWDILDPEQNEKRSRILGVLKTQLTVVKQMFDSANMKRNEEARDDTAAFSGNKLSKETSDLLERAKQSLNKMN